MKPFRRRFERLDVVRDVLSSKDDHWLKDLFSLWHQAVSRQVNMGFA